MSLRWYERVTRHYRVTGVQRGAWAFGPARLLSGDMFGFADREATLPEIDTLLVYPRLVPLIALGLPSDRPFGDFRAMRRLAEDPLRLNGTRDYVAGDSMRHVHWKASARRTALADQDLRRLGQPPAGHLSQHQHLRARVGRARSRFAGVRHHGGGVAGQLGMGAGTGGRALRQRRHAARRARSCASARPATATSSR